jgi:SEC-C motif domain protein
MDPGASCPCTSSLAYADCCGRFHLGIAEAATAEQLMRSRYSAFAVGDADYLLHTWHPRTRPSTVDVGEGLEWLSLHIVEATDDQVEFVARFRGPAGRGFIRERSQFLQLDGRWLYLAPVED